LILLAKEILAFSIRSSVQELSTGQCTISIIIKFFCGDNREQVKAEEQINYLTTASIGYGIEKRVGKRQK